MALPLTTRGLRRYLLASAAFEARACEGVVSLSELPSLMREANAGVECEDRDVDFVYDCASSSRGGHLDSASCISREELIPAFAAWKIREISEQDATSVRGDDLGETSDDADDGGEGTLERLRETEDESEPPCSAPNAAPSASLRTTAWRETEPVRDQPIQQQQQQQRPSRPHAAGAQQSSTCNIL